MISVFDFFKRHTLVAGTLLLTATGFASRFLGFFYRIFLSRAIGAEGLGLYQMIFPVFGICFSLCAGSIQTAISRFVASDAERAPRILRTGFLISFSMSLAAAAVIARASDFLAVHILMEPRCAELLPILALTIPFTSVHACICGYYYGKQKVHIPALSQLVEQGIRMFAVFLIAGICRERQIELTASLAAAGLAIGEAGSALYTLLCYLLFGRPQKRRRKESAQGDTTAPETGAAFGVSDSAEGPASHADGPIARPLMALAAPLMANRLVMNLLQSAEAVLIPSCLILSGLTRTQAVSVYGILTGMSMSFIMFPSAIVNSLAVVLLPSVAKAQSNGNDSGIEKSVALSFRYSLYMGVLFIGIFTIFGNKFGVEVFRNENAGAFITVLAWLCPFLYLSTTLGSILNGLGKTGATFSHNLTAILVRLAFVVFGIPRFGIAACLWGMLASELLLSLMHFFSLLKVVRFRPDAWEVIVKPSFCLIVSLGIFRLFPKELPFPASFPPFVATAFQAGIVCTVYLLTLLLFHRNRKEVFIPS